MGNRYSKKMPTHYSVTNWPKGLQVDSLHINLETGSAEVKLMDGATLNPRIPLVQLSRFLNDHVQGAVKNLSIGDGDGGEGLEDRVLQLLDHMRVPGRLHTNTLIFDGFFHLPWASTKRLLHGRTLRANTIAFFRLQLPSGVDANELFKLPAVRECLTFSLNNGRPQLPGPPPLFDNAALMEWLEQSDDRYLLLASDCLSDGYLSLLDALKKNFQQATQRHTNTVEIICPSINGVTRGLGVRDEELFNRLGEGMVIKVDANPVASEKMGRPFEALRVWRVLLS